MSTEITTLQIQITGDATSNIQVYKESVSKSIEALRHMDLVTDQDFADAAVLVKICKEQEKILEQAKKDAMNKTKSIAETFEEIDHVSEMLRSTRLFFSKKIELEKENRKTSLVNDHLEKISKLTSTIKGKFGLQEFGAILVEYSPGKEAQNAIKGKKNIESMQVSLDDLEKDFKVNFEKRCKEIFDNVEYINSRPDQTIFPDRNSIALHEHGYLIEIVRNREQAAELQRQNEQLKKEAERKDEPAKEEPAQKPEQQNPEPSQNIVNPMKADFEGKTSYGQSFKIEVNGFWQVNCDEETAKGMASWFRDKFGNNVTLLKIG